MRPRCCGLSGLFGGGYAGRSLAFVGDMSAMSSSSAHEVPSRVGDFGVVGGGLLFAYPVRGDAPGNVAEGTDPAEDDDGGEFSGLISDNRVWRRTPEPPKRAMEGGGGQATRSSTMTGAFEPDAMLLAMPGLDGGDMMVEAARRGGAPEPAGRGRDWRKEGAGEW